VATETCCLPTYEPQPADYKDGGDFEGDRAKNDSFYLSSIYVKVIEIWGTFSCSKVGCMQGSAPVRYSHGEI
jgi:hypothetical protein